MEFNPLLPRFLRPPVYQGKRKPGNYFEGWYFKLVDAGGNHIWSVIPGVSFSSDSHCFVQVIHANSGKTYYIKYPVNTFSFARKKFRISVGSNKFSTDSISLDIKTEDLSMKGELLITNAQPFPSSLRSPGIMGWYSYAPFMECYHGVVSMQHQLTGALNINGNSVRFDGGKGYIEKDWGRSMPSDWIWIQSNHFTGNDNASFMISLARIPWLKGYFPGFLSFLKLNDRVYRFATYNRSIVDQVEVTDDFVRLLVKNRKHNLLVKVMRKESGILLAPRHGNMDREIKESIVSTLELELRDFNGDLVFADRGLYAGLEIVGDVAQYFRNIH